MDIRDGRKEVIFKVGRIRPSKVFASKVNCKAGGEQARIASLEPFPLRGTLPLTSPLSRHLYATAVDRMTRIGRR